MLTSSSRSPVLRRRSHVSAELDRSWRRTAILSALEVAIGGRSQMALLERDGVQLHYEVRGDGPAILLSHGFAATSAMFAANIDAFAEAHTVITWDLRGHGDSDSPADP